MTNYDICVFGAGPSGTVIARKLAQLGYSVLIIEKENFPRHNIGLSLTPGIHHWLNLLDLKKEVNDVGFTRACVSIILWESDEPIKKEFKPELAGYHVDRGRFDEILLQSALAEGVDLLQPCTLNRLDQNEDGNWEIILTHRTSKKYISANFVVEATGRKSILKGTHRAYLPHTIATYAYCETASVYKTSFIEAGANEWYWGVPLNNGYLACIFSDPREVKKFDSIQDFYLDKLKLSSLFSSLRGTKEVGNVMACSATAYQDESPISKNYIKVGDAAFTTDPLSSQGVQKAFKSAYQGAVVVNTLLKGENTNAAIDYYNNLIKTEVVKNTRWTKQFYNRQNRFIDGDFWNSRKDLSLKDIDAITKKTISIKKEDRLFINQNAVIANVPVLGKQFVEYKEAIVLDGNDEPFVFLNNVHIPSLIKKMNGKPLLEGLRIIESDLPRSNAAEVLQWLIYHKILSAKKSLISIN